MSFEGKVVKVVGLTIEAEGIKSSVGELCTIISQFGDEIKAEVVGFKETSIILMPLGETLGVALGHKYDKGICTRCQAEDPEYVAPHEHNFVEGKCECGEEDPNYQDNTPTQQPDGNQNSFAAWIQAIIDAIIKFFMELFS